MAAVVAMSVFLFGGHESEAKEGAVMHTPLKKKQNQKMLVLQKTRTLRKKERKEKEMNGQQRKGGGKEGKERDGRNKVPNRGRKG